MRSLVLGGSTFVGRRLVHHLAGYDHEVGVLNRGRTPSELPPDVRRYVDRWTRTEAGWRLAERELRAAGAVGRDDRELPPLGRASGAPG